MKELNYCILINKDYLIMLNDNNKKISWLEDFNEAIRLTTSKIGGKVSGLEEAFISVQTMLKDLQKKDGTLWWAGNGGSSSICSHLAQDVMNNLKIRSQAFSDASLLTMASNDFGYESVYSYPLEIMSRPGDMIILISSSGNSDNILKAQKIAKNNEVGIVTFSGFSSNNKLNNAGSDVDFFLPSDSYGVVEIGHSLLLHCIIDTMSN
jgi:D-sedoheptulose 7-phosphate isomerase